MRPHLPHKQVWQITVEAASPLSVTTGGHDGVDDTRLHVGPNGLPRLPATALAGTLRKLLRAVEGVAAEGEGEEVSWPDQLFGWARGTRGAPSALEFSDALLHGQHDLPITALRADLSDPLLLPLLTQAPAQRRQVRIGHQGAAEPGAHFDRAVLPAGYRFSFDVTLHAANAAACARHADMLLHLLSHRWHVGGRTRSGLGAVKVVALRTRRFDMTKPLDFQAYVALDHLGDPRPKLVPVMPAADTPPALPHTRTAQVRVKCVGALRIGGGTRVLQAGGSADDKVADDLPYSEPTVTWSGPAPGKQQGALAWRVVIPASAIKGALWHRVAFHDARAMLQALDSGQPAATPAATPATPLIAAVQALFGMAAEGEHGHAGAVRLSDLAFTQQQLLGGHHLGPPDAHNSMDRLSGGGRSGALFSVQNLYHLPLHIDLHLDEGALGRQAGSQERAAQVRQALAHTLDDLVEQRLPLGADGLGFVTGHWGWEPATPNTHSPVQEAP